MRRQFGKAGEETVILDYPLHRYRLMPVLANCIMLQFLGEYVCDQYAELKDVIQNDPETDAVQELHVKLSIFKPLSSWWAQHGA